MPAAALLLKAERALRSARRLLEDGDIEGATDRGYYALFHAARAVLAAVVPEQQEWLKTHSSVIAAFGLVAVRTLRFPPHTGRLINFAEELRRKADYDSMVFADGQAITEILSGADEVMVLVRAIVLSQGDSGS